MRPTVTGGGGAFIRTEPTACRYCGFVAVRQSDEDCPTRLARRRAFRVGFTAGLLILVSLVIWRACA